MSTEEEAAAFVADIERALVIGCYQPPSVNSCAWALHHLCAIPHLVIDQDIDGGCVVVREFTGEPTVCLRAWCGLAPRKYPLEDESP